MIALDTNVLVRLLVRDDKPQFDKVVKFMDSLTASNPGFVCREVLLELVWVLERTYGFNRDQISQAINGIIDSKEIYVEDVNRVRLVNSQYKVSSHGFSDLMVLSITIKSGSTEVVTFDKRFSQLDSVVLLR